MPERSPTDSPRPRRPAKTSTSAAKAAPVVEQVVEQVDTSYLETLIGYNTRRAALAIIAEFLPGMAAFGLRPVEFSVLVLIADNPGITARQLCDTLDILPPNLVGMIKDLEKRGLVEKRNHPNDRRAQGLYLREAGNTWLQEARQTATELEIKASNRLSTTERKTLMRLLQKIYLSEQ